ncbi:MAG: hypothetical protein ACK41E_04125 [Deinococcales bacterium]
MKFLLTLLLLLCSSVFAQEANLTVTPAADLERGLTAVQGQKLEFRIRPGIPDLQTVTLNITRGGRVLGEYAMRREGEEYVASLVLELPNAHILTVRLFQAQRVWSSALDFTVLEPQDAKQIPGGSSYNKPLRFSVTEGKAGDDTSPIWGLVPLIILALGVFIVTKGKKKTKGGLGA